MSWSITIPILLLLATLGCSEASDDPDDFHPIDNPPVLDSIPVSYDALFETEFLLPPRDSAALNGDQLVDILRPLPLKDRETRILAEVLSGNVPGFQRDLVPVIITETLDSTVYLIAYYVTPEYFCIGTDSNYFRIPMTPILAQELADSLGCIMPTRKMVNEIWAAAEVKLEPHPIPPSSAMTTIPVFEDHNDYLRLQRSVWQSVAPLGSLVAGHKKDVILSNRININLDKVVIYGWHYLSGSAIQPLYSGHVNWYADYSHGVRLVKQDCIINGEAHLITDILSDATLYKLLSDEFGRMQRTRYDTDKHDYP